MFSKPKTDDAGSISTVKEVGYFKGMVKVTNPDQRDDFQQKKEAKDKAVTDLIKKIHRKQFNTDMEIDIDSLETQEGK